MSQKREREKKIGCDCQLHFRSSSHLSHSGKTKGTPLTVCPNVLYTAALMAFTCQPNKMGYLHVSAADIMSCGISIGAAGRHSGTR